MRRDGGSVFPAHANTGDPNGPNRGLSANENARALISMMARSKCSNQRPDTLMQDRSPPARRNHLQRTAGPYIWVNNGRISARCDRRAMIAASIRIYALVARGHRLRRHGRGRKRCEIRVLVVADPYAGIGDEPVSGGDSSRPSVTIRRSRDRLTEDRRDCGR
jgi:hypothetical protein